MELTEIEVLAMKFKEMLAKHPELCPHFYDFEYSDYEDYAEIMHLRCRFCGHTKTETVYNP